MADVTVNPESEQALAARRLRARNWALFGLLFGFAIAVFLITIIKMRP